MPPAAMKKKRPRPTERPRRPIPSTSKESKKQNEHDDDDDDDRNPQEAPATSSQPEQSKKRQKRSPEEEEQRAKFMKDYRLTEEDLLEYEEEFESDPFNYYQVTVLNKFQKMREHTKHTLYRLRQNIFYNKLNKIRSLYDQLNDPIIQLSLDNGDFLDILNELGKKILSENDRKAIRLVMMKVISDLYSVINPTKSSEVPKLVIKYEKGYGTADVQITEEYDDVSEEERRYREWKKLPMDLTKNKKIGWYSMIKSLFEKYEIDYKNHFPNEKYFHLLRTTLIKQNTHGQITSMIRTFLEDVLFFHCIDINDIATSRHLFQFFSSFPEQFDFNFIREHPMTKKMMTPMALAIYRHAEEIVSSLIQRKAKLVDLDEDGNSVLHLAVLYKAPSSLLLLLCRKCLGSELSVDEPNKKHQQTPLHLAVLAGDLKSIQTLLRFHADVRRVDDKQRDALQLVDSEECVAAVPAANVRTMMKTILTAPRDPTLDLLAEQRQDHEQEQDGGEGDDNDGDEEVEGEGRLLRVMPRPTD